MAKVRTISVKSGYGIDEVIMTAFVYRGYYAIKGQKSAYHTPNILRDNTHLGNVHDDDVFSMDHSCFDTAEYFKKVIDEHIEYLIGAHGSLEKYFALNY
jgi:hypothetical protein